MGQLLRHNLERNKKTFLRKARKKHNNKYDYSESNYINTHTKIVIICPIHGRFEQTPSRHLNSHGCNKCRITKYSSKKKFIDKAIKIHGGRYDYSKVEYVNNDTPVTITCQKHGEFSIRPRSHTSSKSGCPKCWRTYELTPIERARQKFNSKFQYINGEIICPIHGNTGYTIHEHVKTTHGCRKCYDDSRRMAISEYLSIVNQIHNNKYTYPNIYFSNQSDKITIICPKHGEFRQTAGSHLYEKKGCWRCSHVSLTNSNFVSRAKTIHGDKYDYSLVNCKNVDSKVQIICKEHGVFWQRPVYHLNGNIGCKRCQSSKLQSKIVDFIKSFGVNYTECDRNNIQPLEIDIFIPKYNVGIEVHGNYFHSYNYVESVEERNRHYRKAELATNNDIHLLQFYEHEINNKWKIVQSMISHMLKQSNRIYGRKCEIRAISHIEAKQFFDKSHIDGHVPSTVYYGLVYGSELVSAISMTKRNEYWEIIRYATKTNNVVIGGFSKLLNYFINKHQPNKILTFANRRFSIANVYLLNGFKLVKITKPNYIYLNSGGKYAGQRQKFQKHKLPRILKNYNPKLTEAENMFMNGYRRLWDAGHIKLEYASI